MSRLEFYIVIFCSRATMIEHFQNNSECNIQHKVIESDTIFIHGEDHFNRSTSEYQKHSGQHSLKTQSVFLSLQPLMNHRLIRITTELGASRLITLCSHVTSTFLTPSTTQKYIHSLNFCQHILYSYRSLPWAICYRHTDILFVPQTTWSCLGVFWWLSSIGSFFLQALHGYLPFRSQNKCHILREPLPDESF